MIETQFVRQWKEPIVSTLIYDSLGEDILINDESIIEEINNYPCSNITESKNVFLLICDALRSDHMGIYNYERNTTPFLTQLDKKGILQKVENSYSLTSRSFTGISSILSSRYGLYSNNFFIHDILNRLGYEIYFILSGDHTNYYNEREYYGGNIDYYTDGYLNNKSKKYNSHSINDDSTNILLQLNNIKSNGRPIFSYFHFMTTHQLGKTYSDFRQYNINHRYITKSKLINEYDDRVLQLDSYIKSTISILEKNNLLNNSIVIITSDHGQPLLEKGRFGHGKTIYYNDISIPLIIIDFSENKSIKKGSTFFATQLDVSPTILDILDMPIPSFWEGQSIFVKRKTKYTFHHESDYYSVISTENSKVIQYILNQKTKSEEIYDLIDDPTQIENLLNVFDLNKLNELRIELKMFYNFSLDTNL